MVADELKSARGPGWYVIYRIPSFDECEIWAGPFDFLNLGVERDDICGYEGVQFVRYEKV